ncbi:MAG: hypothetical protein WC902_11620 [Bacteroidales bacterium]
MQDPTQISLGAEQETGSENEVVVVIVHDLTADTYTVETDAGPAEAGTLDEALNAARGALEGSPPDQVRDEIANEVYPTEEGMGE